MEYNVLNGFDEDSWNTYVSRHPKGHLFHTPAVYKIYQSARRLSPLLIIVTDDNKQIAGLALGEIADELFVFSGLTRHVTFYAEPIYNGDEKVLKLILNNILKQSKGLFIEIRPIHAFNENEIYIYKELRFIKQDHLDAKITLTSKDEIEKNISSDKQQGIKDAGKNNIVVVEKNDGEGMKICYSLLKDLYFRKRHFIKSEQYFQNLLCMPNFRILLAYINKEPIAVQLFYVYKNTITAYYTATNKEYMNKHAGDLLIWKLMEIGINEGRNIFDFGGAGNPDEYSGIREYKRGFGTRFENIGRYIYKRSYFYTVVKSIYSLILKP